MNPTELDDKLLSSLLPLLVAAAVSGILSWQIWDLMKGKIEQGSNWAAIKTALTICCIVTLIAGTAGGLWVGYRHIRLEATKEQPPKPPDTQAATVATPTPHGSSSSERAFRGRIRPSRPQAPAPTPETAQANNAPITPQTSQVPDATPPAQSPSPESPSMEARPLLAPAQSPGCNPTPPPATIIPPGEKVPEPDQLV